MSVIVEVKGKKETKYKALVRIKGYSTKCKYFKKKTDAKIWANTVETAMQNGTYIEHAENPVIAGGATIKTMADLITYFEENEAKYRYSYPEKYKVMYDWWRNKIGRLKCSEVTSSILADCKRLLMTEDCIKPAGKLRGSSTINKYLMALSAVITFGMKEYKLWAVNPMHDVEKRKLPDLRTRFLSEEEIAILKAGARKKSYRLYIFVLIALTTGGRYSEVRDLQVENIDFKHLKIHYLNTKNNTNRGVPVSHRLLIKIKAYMKIYNIESGYLFLNNKKTGMVYMKGAFEQLIKDLGIKDFRFHDLRHTAASYFLMSGATIIELMELFGWTSQSMAKRYAHLTETHTANLANKVSNMMLDF